MEVISKYFFVEQQQYIRMWEAGEMWAEAVEQADSCRQTFTRGPRPQNFPLDPAQKKFSSTPPKNFNVLLPTIESHFQDALHIPLCV